MTTPFLQPFAGLRPIPKHAQDVAAPPYDVVSIEEAKAIAQDNKLSFLHISKPNIDLPQGTNPYAEEVYAKAAENMAYMLEEGVLCRDDKPSYYIYRVQMGDHIQTGIVGAGSVEAYEKNLIRRHELTHPDKETDRVKQIMAVNAQTGPVFTAHKHDDDLLAVTKEVTNGEAAYTIISEGGVSHTLWVVTDRQKIDRITDGFERLGVIYIADGHHRSAAASRVAAKCKNANEAHTGSEPYNTFLVVSFPKHEVRILDYNRVVKDLNGLSLTRLIERIEKSFEVDISHLPAKPKSAQSFAMYVSGNWYVLSYKDKFNAANPLVDTLDVRILTANILSPVLGIGDPRTDDRIDFVGGIRGMTELERRVNTGDWGVAFALFPTSITQLMEVADAHELMPPKTTWFEPKLVDGLISLVLD